VASSLIQKAIRRGRTELALDAAAALLEQSPERLWRRLACIVFEDVGLGDPELVALTSAAMAGKRARAVLGGEWAVASYLTSRMSQATKCRGADYLLLVAENHCKFEDQRLQLAFSTTAELIRALSSTEPLPVRASATWFLLGTDRRPSPRLARRRGAIVSLFAALCEILPAGLVEIVKEGHHRSGEALPKPERASIQDDEMPAETMLGAIPGWCLDVYTRPGRAALSKLIGGSMESARWVRAQIPSRQRVTFLGTIVFRLEGNVYDAACDGGQLTSCAGRPITRATAPTVGTPPKFFSLPDPT